MDNPYELGTFTYRDWNYGQFIAQQREFEFQNKYGGFYEQF
jgi:hypothetical protein